MDLDTEKKPINFDDETDSAENTPLNFDEIDDAVIEDAETDSVIDAKSNEAANDDAVEDVTVEDVTVEDAKFENVADEDTKEADAGTDFSDVIANADVTAFADDENGENAQETKNGIDDLLTFGQEDENGGFTDEEIENSTVFSKNTSFKEEKKKSAKKSGWKLIIILAVAAVVIGAGVFAAIKFIPDLNKSNEEENLFDIKVKAMPSEEVEKIVIHNQSGDYVIKMVELDKTNSDDLDKTAEWQIENVDMELLSSSSIGMAADSAISVFASREMTDKNLDYGLDKPYITAEVIGKSGATTENYSIAVGNMAPDKSGYYLKASGDDKIYFVSTGTVTGLDMALEKMANSIIIETPAFDDTTKTEDKKYFDEQEGTPSTFDYIDVSGSHYSESFKLTGLSNNEMAKYLITNKAGTRYADEETVESMFGFVTNGLVAIETYKLYPTADDLKKYKLDNPEIKVSIKMGSYSYNIKASMYDKEKNYYAVAVDGKNAIYAVTAAALEMVDANMEKYYNKFVFLEYVQDFSKLELSTPGGNYSFDISYDKEKEEITVKTGGKKLDDSLFRAYYTHFTTISPTAAESYVDASPAITAKFTFANTSKGQKTLTLIKQSDRRYLVTVDGQKMGVVSSTVFDHLNDYAKNVMEGKGVPDA